MTEEMINKLNDIVNANYPVNVSCDMLKKICQAALDAEMARRELFSANLKMAEEIGRLKKNKSSGR